MKFSCITTTYNDGQLLRQSIASILNQSHLDLEILLVDDGSEQDPSRIISGLDNSRITVLPQANDGLSSARNRGLHHAKGDYICFLDADDVRAPWALAQVATLIEQTKAELVMVSGLYSHARTRLDPFMDHGNTVALEAEMQEGPIGLGARKAWATSFEPQSANEFISRQLVERAKLRFPNDHFFEDILFHILAICHARSIEFLFTPSFTYFQRQLRPQLTGAIAESW